MSEELRNLVARIQQGNREALDEFVRAYGDHIRRAAKRRLLQLGLEEEIEPDEILNSTILELCRSSDRIEAIELEELWLYVDRVVRSKATEAWRRKNARKRGGGWRAYHGRDERELPDPRPQAADDIELNETIGRTYDELTGDERMISMFRRSGWSWEEIATRLCSTADAVRKRWERAVARVLRLLD